MKTPTASPWNFVKTQSYEYVSQPTGLVLTFTRHPEDQDLTHANLALIEAAPEMLVEIKRYLSIARREGWHATVFQLEKIISKIEVES